MLIGLALDDYRSCKPIIAKQIESETEPHRKVVIIAGIVHDIHPEAILQIVREFRDNDSEIFARMLKFKQHTAVGNAARLAWLEVNPGR